MTLQSEYSTFSSIEQLKGPSKNNIVKLAKHLDLKNEFVQKASSFKLMGLK